MFTRRKFLQSSLVALAPTVPLFVARTARAAGPERDDRVLVVVELDGGNDALNTVVPYSKSEYARLRPKLKLDKNELILLNDSAGLHPSFKPLGKLLEAGHLAVLPGVGYPNPNRSHFRSMAIWHTARFDPEEHAGYGWLGRALDPSASGSFAVGGTIPGALRGRRSPAVSLNRIEEVLLTSAIPPQSARLMEREDLLGFVQREAVTAGAAANNLAKLAGGMDGSTYPPTALAERLKLVARFLKADLGARVFYTFQGGYDTHANQRFAHAGLLSEFAGAVAGFFADLTAARLADRVVLLAFSEFGRTIRENGSVGTDHGTAGAVFLAGSRIQGGVIGQMPSLTDLTAGEPKMTTDFRQVYATVLANWLELPGGGIPKTFEPLPIISKT